MGETPGSPTLSRKLQDSAQQATRSPAMGFNNRSHVLDRACLWEASRQPPKRSAPGMDQVTAKPYAEQLDEHLRDLQERRRTTRSVAPPVARGWIEQEGGKQRPRGKPCCEDTSVPRAVVMIVEAIVAEDVQALSHGVRKGQSPHQALHELREQCRTLPITWSVDAEVRGCFDTLDWDHLREWTQQRVRDGGIRRRMGTWLHAGVLEAGEVTSPDKGTPQGGGVSPMFAKVFLPQGLDAWCVKDVHPRRRGRCVLMRVADECILGCEHEADARRVMEVLPKRCSRFSLTMHPEKTAWMAFKRPPSRDQAGGGTGPVALLGLTPYWGTTRQGDWVIKRKTIGKRLRRCMQEIWTWGGEHPHDPLQEQ